MEDLEKTQRLKEILAKLDPRAETRVREGGLFKSAELLRRKLVHEGNLLWKTPGSRHKGAQHWKVTVIQCDDDSDAGRTPCSPLFEHQLCSFSLLSVIVLFFVVLHAWIPHS